MAGERLCTTGLPIIAQIRGSGFNGSNVFHELLHRYLGGQPKTANFSKGFNSDASGGSFGVKLNLPV